MTWNTFAPRLGVTYDISGDGKTVVKGHYGRYFINIADDLSAANPARLRVRTFKVPRSRTKTVSTTALGSSVSSCRNGERWGQPSKTSQGRR